MHPHLEWLWASAATLWPTMGGALGAFAVGAAGAYFGARGAQRSINALDTFRRKSEAIALANSAQSLTHVIANQALVLKVRHFKPTCDEFLAQKERIEARIASGNGGQLDVVVAISHLPPIAMPVDQLQSMVFGKIPLNAQALGALAQLAQANHTLHELTIAHGDLFKELRNSPTGHIDYLGLETAKGADTRYRDLVVGLVDVADDFYVFADILQNELLEYATQVRAKASWRQRRRLPNVNELGEVLEAFKSYLPDKSRYDGWVKGYVVTKNPTIEDRIRTWFIRSQHAKSA